MDHSSDEPPTRRRQQAREVSVLDLPFVDEGLQVRRENCVEASFEDEPPPGRRGEEGEIAQLGRKRKPRHILDLDHLGVSQNVGHSIARAPGKRRDAPLTTRHSGDALAQSPDLTGIPLANTRERACNNFPLRHRVLRVRTGVLKLSPQVREFRTHSIT